MKIIIQQDVKEGKKLLGTLNLEINTSDNNFVPRIGDKVESQILRDAFKEDKCQKVKKVEIYFNEKNEDNLEICVYLKDYECTKIKEDKGYSNCSLIEDHINLTKWKFYKIN